MKTEKVPWDVGRGEVVMWVGLGVRGREGAWIHKNMLFGGVFIISIKFARGRHYLILSDWFRRP